MRVLGIDPGLRRTGYGCVELLNGRETIVEAGVLRIPEKPPLAQRLSALDTPLRALLAELKPDHVVVESVFAHRLRGHTSMLMGHARGVILLAIASAGLEVMELAPAEVKKAVTGSGRADKKQLARVVTMLLGKPVEGPHDAVDAVAIAMTHHAHSHHHEVVPRVTRSHRRWSNRD